MEKTARFDTSAYHWHYMTGFLADAGAHPFMMEANGRHALYTRAPIYINKGEYIVGNLDWAIACEPVINRISMNSVQGWVVDEIRTSEELSEAEKADFEAKLAAMAPYIHANRCAQIYTEAESLAQESGIAICNHFNGHQVLDYALLLERGIGGLVGTFQDKARGAPEGGGKTGYLAMARAFEGAAEFIRRHALAARQICEAQEYGYDGEALQTIIALCEAVAWNAPRSFLQGLQLLWFFMGFADYDSFGRFDQYMYPLYQKSLAAGESRQVLKAHLEEFWRKLDQAGYILNMTIGGIKPDGGDAANELTRLVLEVTRELGLKGPNLCLRITWDADDALWRQAKEGIGSQNALPALYNDAVILPMLRRQGIGEEDANDYCLAGCSQVVIPGKSSFACDMGEYNLPKCLELALNDGYDSVLGRQVGPHTGDPAGFDSFEGLLEAYRRQAFHAIEMGTALNDKDHLVRGDTLSCIRSALTADCVERGLGLFGGGARYYAVQNEVVGGTNLADSLAAIRMTVYEEKRYTLPQVVAACNANFEGCEEMRQVLLRKAPKFGNDIDSVDQLRAALEREFFSRLAEHPAPLGGVHWPGEVIFHYNVAMGQTTKATPDGRLAFTPFADSAGAAQGCDLAGPTGILNSMAKLPFTGDAYPNTCSCLNIKFTKELWDKAGDKIIALFRTYFKRGGFQLQINVTNQADLIAAKLHPEQYRGLVVRVGGYNGYFVHLAESIQDDIIARHGQTALV